MTDIPTDFQIADYLEIQQLIHRFNLTFDEGDGDGVADLFVDGGSVVSGAKKRGTRAELKAWVEDAASRETHRHYTTNVVIEPSAVDPARASARACFLYVSFDGDGPAVQSFGTYTDELVKQDGRWLFQRRTTTRAEPSAKGEA